MKTDIYRVFEMNVTEEEMKIIKSFCSFLDDMLYYTEDSDYIFDIVRCIKYDMKNTLKEKNFKINIEEKD